ncbi:MAG: SBBP repeat-containing protein [bacterium]
MANVECMISRPRYKVSSFCSTLVIAFLGLFFAVQAQVDTNWVRRFTGPGTGSDGFTAVTVDSRGQVYVAGYVTDTVALYNIITMKFTADGVLQWYQRYSGPGNGNDCANGIVVDEAGNVYVTGYATTSTGSDYCTIKYDSLGNELWVRFYNGTSSSTTPTDIATAIALDRNGNVYVTGYSEGAGTSYDYCTIMYSPSGAEQWVVRYNNSSANGYDQAFAIAVDRTNNVYVTGYSVAGNGDYLTIKYNALGTQQWVARYDGGNGYDLARAIAIDRMGNCYVTGFSRGGGTADYDYLTIKYTSNGTREWVARYNGSGNDNDYAYSVAVDEAGYVVVTGASDGVGTASDICTIRYDQNGNSLWVQRYDANHLEDAGRCVALDSSGNCYVSGYSRTANYDFSTISYDPNGGLRWLVFYNDIGNGNDYSNVTTVDRTGNVVVAGYSYGGSQSGNDAVVIKYIQPDVAAQEILSPEVRVDTASSIVPQAVVANLGSAPADIRAYFSIRRPGGSRIFYDSALVSGVGPGETALVTFAEWAKPHQIGVYVASCSTWRRFDRDLSNNVQLRNFQVTAGPYGWVEVTTVPLAPSGRAVKDGAALAYFVGADRIYCVKGNRTGDFYYYQPAQDNWVTLPVIPNGPSGKTTGRGVSLVSDNNRYLYLVRGNKTLEFWRFDTDSTVWVQMANIPSGPSNRPVKCGAEMVFVPQENSIYLLKGYRNEFYRYLVGSDEWQTMPDAPLPSLPKWDDGSFLVFDGENSLYAGKAKYNELWRFDRTSGSWDTLNRLLSLPYVGRSGKNVKLKDGGCGAYYDGSIYVLKGSNSCEFWRYDIIGDSWLELDPMPDVGSTQKRKRIKRGGDIVFGGDALYALKGNKTVEFWRYAISPGIDTAFAGGQVWEDGAALKSVICVPNPVSGTKVNILLSPAVRGNVRFAVFDATGRVQISGNVASSEVIGLNIERLSAGVYFVRLDSEKGRFLTRLVIER